MSKQVADLEAKIIDVSANIITFLDFKKDPWTFNNQFMFENNKDIETINSYWDRIGELADKEDLIQKQKLKDI